MGKLMLIVAVILLTLVGGAMVAVGFLMAALGTTGFKIGGVALFATGLLVLWKMRPLAARLDDVD